MNRSFLKLYASLWLASLPLAIGCRGGLATNETTTPTFAATEQIAPDPTGLHVSDPASGAPEKHDEDAMLQIVAELSELGALDEASKAALLDDLREADPENWPMIAKQFRSVLAFRKQLAAREAKAGDELTSTEPQVESISMSTRRPRRVEPTPSPLALESAPALVEMEQPQPTQPPRAERTEAAVEVAKRQVRQLAAPVVLNKPPQRPLRNVSYQAVPSDAGEWQTHVRQAVLGLQSEVQPEPGSPDEVNAHMRLRLLQLLSGDQESALMPIPGANAPQQDYWNQQLFAVSTYLDSKTQPDNKRRAAGSLAHLDQARAKLAELATLQVRSLAFVDSVDGYGAYEPLKESKFRPGQELTLYAEIENFSSQSTKDGHLTRLGTSFEIVDGNGKRVDSAQFPEVEDLCKTVRRDFHMQYTITIPTRIYPETYKLRLIVTDQQSHKIGQASLPFEISE